MVTPMADEGQETAVRQEPKWKRWFRPFLEIYHGMDHALAGDIRRLPLMFLGLLLGWWIYVPLHELLHALGCLAAGGEVTRLEIDALYGGTVLAEIFPWVIAESEYAGRLSGFSTRGSDLVYLVTVLAPYALTLWPGLWALRYAVRKGSIGLFSAMIPWAFAPFISWVGDAYEIGSILVTRLPIWSSETLTQSIRGDDLFLITGRMWETGAGGLHWAGVVFAAMVGLIWAYGWWFLADLFARWLGQAEIEAPRLLEKEVSPPVEV